MAVGGTTCFETSGGSAANGLTITPSSAFNTAFGAATAISYVGWVWIDTLSNQDGLFGRGERTLNLGGMNLSMGWNYGTSGGVWIELAVTGADMGSSRYVDFNHTGLLVTGKWQLIAGVVDLSLSGDNRFKIYAGPHDGSVVEYAPTTVQGSATMPSDFSSMDNTDFTIGIKRGFYNGNANGEDRWFREVSVYDFALTSVQVGNFFNSGDGATPSDVGVTPILYVPLDPLSSGTNESTGMTTALTGTSGDAELVSSEPYGDPFWITEAPPDPGEDPGSSVDDATLFPRTPSADRYETFATWITIEGIGPRLSDAQLTAAGDDDRYRFCSDLPAYAYDEPENLWRPYLAAHPNLLSERLPPVGGIVELGQLSVEIVDINNFLTTLFATEKLPVGSLRFAINATAPAFTLWDGGQVNGTLDPFFIDGEAMVPNTTGWVAGISSSNRRGSFGTTATPHEVGAPVYSATPFLRERDVHVYIAPLDATSRSEALLIGTYTIEGLSWDETLCAYRILAKSKIYTLDATLPLGPRTFDIVSSASGMEDGLPGVIQGEKTLNAFPTNHWPSSNGSSSSFIYIGDEVMGGSVDPEKADFTCERRKLALTEASAPAQGEQARQVFAATYESSSFRYSPTSGGGQSEDRESGTWTETQHPLEILLCILTSSANADDGLELTNYDASYPNYSSLPVGYGAGIPATAIDWASWAEVIDRTSGYRLPYIVYGRKDTIFRRWVDDEILKPIGAYIVARNGILYCHKPRLPLTGESLDTYTWVDVLATGDSASGYRPELTVSYAIESAPSSFGFELGPEDTTTVTVRADVAQKRGDSLSIPVEGADPSDASWWTGEAINRVRELYRPKVVVRGLFKPRIIDRLVGDFVTLILPEIPNMKGSRALNNLARITYIEMVTDDADRGVHVNATFEVYANETQVVPRIAPAAFVDTVGGNSADLFEHRYTSVNPRPGLTDNDISAFEVGDTVELYDNGGAPTGATETIVSFNTTPGGGTQNVTFSGNFGGALAGGTTVVAIEYANAPTARRERWGYMAGTDYLVEGNAPYLYGVD